ncbi:MAG: polyhydroxyalkanoic acid synthase [Erythrobacter sp.]|uniref:PHA/PHB synthase family protein n=1 Tax=Erythrobacter sp. TaxID=1042 RepID=UPI001B0D9BA0|nr:alpha/beta fold hydrolase [Erythrobacter sp.]MBO6531343.1 polyhydroxyalkanoic acid synthase [Erythrobacter sp.]
MASDLKPEKQPSHSLEALSSRPPARLKTGPLPFAYSSHLSPPADSHSVTTLGEVIDRTVRANASRYTGGLSPIGLWLAYADWAMHLAASPGKQGHLRVKAVRKAIRYLTWLGTALQRSGDCPDCIDPLPQDKRFASDAWKSWPFNALAQGFLLSQQWWHNATTGVKGVDADNEAIVTFATRQVLDWFAPTNIPWLNPDVLEATLSSGGANLVNGYKNFVEDWERLAGGKPPVGAEAFPVGERVATTPGQVVYRNRLIELIQYAPTTEKVHSEPILITPAWIMKYYILDLSPENSLVRYLTDQGFTVFMISWKNPGPEDRDLGMNDYLDLGFRTALEEVRERCDDHKVHAVGYCLGGTLLSIAGAAMRAACHEQLASLSFFAAQADFKEAGELTLFINESQITLLEDMMWEQGFLDTTQMSGAFQILRSNDLVFSRNLRTYLLGERDEMTDMMAWNADATRMPHKMHGEYLRKLFLNNDLAEGRMRVDNRPIFLSDIRTPIFALGTERDHIAPWKSVFKLHRLTDAEMTFVLASGGHNGGVVSQPGRSGRHYRILTSAHDAPHVDPDTWLEQADLRDGSWWPAWADWLASHSTDRETARVIKDSDDSCADRAPGRYVLMH